MVDDDPRTDSRWWSDRLFRAVTLYPWATMDADAELSRLAERDVDTVFVVTKESDGRVFYDSDVAPAQVPARDVLADIVDAADAHDLRVVPRLFVLCDEYLADRHPEVVQVGRDGTEIRYPNVSAEWMHWVCPRHDPVREHLLAVVEELLAYDVDGLQFTHYEYQPIRNSDADYRSCYCEACLERYESAGVQRENEAWIGARCDAVAELLERLTAPVREREDLLTNVEFETFADLDTADADGREILGVDAAAITELADVVTPRTDHVNLDVHPLWIRDAVRWFSSQTDAPVVPSVRTAGGPGDPERLTDAELETAVQMALHGGASGVSLFSAGANVGRITSDQWDQVGSTFGELADFEHR